MILVSEAGWRLASGLLAESVAPELASTMMEENARAVALARFVVARMMVMHDDAGNGARRRCRS